MTTIILSNDEIVNVPEGADPEAFRRYAEGLVKRSATSDQRPARRTRASRAGSHRRTLRTAVPVVSGYEEQAHQVGRAMGELAGRVNGRTAGDQPGETSSVLVNCGGRFYGVVEVS